MKEFLLLRSEDDIKKIQNLEYYNIVENYKGFYEHIKKFSNQLIEAAALLYGENSSELTEVTNKLHTVTKDAESKAKIRGMRTIDEWLDCYLEKTIKYINFQDTTPEHNSRLEEIYSYFTVDKTAVHENTLWEFNKCLATDAELLNMLKKDILCLVALTCYYWKAESKTSKKQELKNDTQIDGIVWEINLETKENSVQGIIETPDFLMNLKKMIIENPDIWNRESKKATRNRYKIEKIIIDDEYKNLNAEEQYFYQYITGFPIAIELFIKGKMLDPKEVQKFVDAICSIKGVHIRSYLTKQYCDKKGGNRLAEYMINFGGAEQIGYEIMQMAWTFLKLLILSLSERNEQEWSDNVFNQIERNYELLDENKAKIFWLTDDFLSAVDNIKTNSFGDARNKANVNYTELQKKIKDKNLSNREKSGWEIKFLPYFDISQIVRTDKN